MLFRRQRGSRHGFTTLQFVSKAAMDRGGLVPVISVMDSFRNVRRSHSLISLLFHFLNRLSNDSFARVPVGSVVFQLIRRLGRLITCPVSSVGGDSFPSFLIPF